MSRYRFIQEHRERWPLALLLKVLEVSRSGYYGIRTHASKPENTSNLSVP